MFLLFLNIFVINYNVSKLKENSHNLKKKIGITKAIKTNKELLSLVQLLTDPFPCSVSLH